MRLATSVETIHAETTDHLKYLDGLWNDNDGNNGIPELEKDSVKLSPIMKQLKNSPLAFAVGYDFWFQDVLKNCGNFDYFDVAKCVVYGGEDLCEVFHCLSPTLGIEACPSDTSGQLMYFAQRMCNYGSCTHNMIFPIPPTLNSLFLQNGGKYFRTIYNFYDYIHLYNNYTTICIHPHNNLEYIDASNFYLGAYQTPPPGVNFPITVTGLTKVKYLNVQGCHLSYAHVKLPSPEMESLIELHIGGNILAVNDIIPADMLQNQRQLSVLNLSNANLQGIEADTFENHHHLSVLDLSYNRLNVSSLVNLDLSNTIIKSLNLSHNELTAIPRSFQDQLDNMKSLELYLSGNTFICSCDNLEFLHWVQSSTQITFHYAGDHVCADSPGNTIHTIAVDSLYCNWYWMQPIIIVCSSLGLLLIVLAIVSIYKKRYSISNMIFRLHERFRISSEDHSNVSYRYDAFVLYSSVDEDRLWVHYELVNKLEKVYGFRLCIHHRDFMPGNFISDNIEQAIRSSRKVLVIMSENFLRSGWCIEEVHMTWAFDRNKFVVVMYKDVLLSGAPISFVIQRLLQSKTYIDWNEAPEAQKLFWKKLRRALFCNRQQTSNVSTSDQSIPVAAAMNEPLLMVSQI